MTGLVEIREAKRYCADSSCKVNTVTCYIPICLPQRAMDGDDKISPLL